MTTVFISWSGKKSHDVALVLRKWLPLVIQSVEPYVSSEDIEKGKRWNDDVAAKLEKTGFGILCLTREALDSNWIQFEAGALSKMVSTARVVPVLIDISPSDVKYPLAQFQMTSLVKDDFFSFIRDLNATIAAPLPVEILTLTFENWWHMVEDIVKIASKDYGQQPENRPLNEQKSIEPILEKLEDLFSVFRGLENIVADPRKLLPAEYLEFVLTKVGNRLPFMEFRSTNTTVEKRTLLAMLNESIDLLLNMYPKLSEPGKKTMKDSTLNFLRAASNHIYDSDGNYEALREKISMALEYIERGRHAGG